MFENPTHRAAASLFVRQSESVANNLLDRESIDRRAVMAALVDGVRPFEDLRDSIDRSRTAIERNEEGSLRARAAQRKAEAEATALYNLDWTVEDEPVIASMIDERISLGGREAYSLEEAYIDGLADYAATGEDYMEMEDRGFEEVRRHRLINLSTAQTSLENSRVRRENRPWGWAVFEFGAQALPFWSTSTEGAGGSWGDVVLSGERVRERAREFNNMVERPPEEFAPWFQAMVAELRENATKFGYFDQTLFERTLFSITQDAPTVRETNLYGTLDNTPAVGLAASTARRAVINPIQGIVRQGSRRRAADVISQALTTADEEGVDVALSATGLASKGDLLSSVSPQALNPWGLTTEVSLGPQTFDLLDEARAVLDDALEGLPGTRRLEGDEITAANTRTQTRLETRLGRPLQDVAVDETTLTDGSVVRTVSGYVGRADGKGGYASERSARRYAESIGLDDFEIRPDDSGQFFIRARMDVAETGMYTRPLNTQSATTALSRFLLSARANSDEGLMAAGLLSGNRRQRIIRDVIQPYQQQLSRLKGREQDTLAAIWQVGGQRMEWFSRSQFENLYERATGAVPSTRVYEAYKASIRMNDMEWTLRNESLYRERLTRGMETITFESPGLSVNRMNGQVLGEVPARDGVFDLSTGEYFRPGQLDSIPDGYRMVRLETPETTTSGYRVRTVMAPQASIKTSALRMDQLGYRPGGHRMYQGDRFVRQARSGKNPDGSQYWENDRTFIVGRTNAEVQTWADTMNAARVLVAQADNLDDPALVRLLDEEVFQGDAIFGTGQRFIDDVKGGRIQLEHEFEVLGDRQTTRAGRNGANDIDMVDEEGRAIESWMTSQDGMYYGRRGDDALLDYRGETAPVLDLYEMMNRSMRNIANISSLGDYKTEALERWAATFGRYVRNGEGMSPAELFINGQIVDAADNVRESAESTRAAIRNILGWRDEAVREADHLNRRIIDRFAGSVPGSARHDFVANAAQWWRSQNPVAALTGAAFDMKLGLFNIAQFPLQISQMAAITALSPRHAAGAWMNHIPAYTYFINGSDSVLEELIKRGAHRMAGFEDADDYRAYMRYLRNGGYTDVGGNHVLISEFGPSAALANVSGPLRQIREAGRIPFYQAEVFNRIMAQQVAWREVSERMGNVSRSDPEFLRQVALRADDFAFNMTGETRAWWQKGVMSVPTQFWSYSARMMEAMLTDKFSRSARAQLFLSQSVLYGTSGMMFYELGRWMLGGAQDFFGARPNPSAPNPAEIGTLRSLFERGLIDQAWYAMTGQDVRIGERYGTGDFAGQLIREVAGQGDYGDVSVAEFIGGASMSVWYDTLFVDGGRLMRDMTSYLLMERGAEDDRPLPADAFQAFAMNVSSVSNALKAHWIANHNTYISTTGRVLNDDIPSSNALAALLSYRPEEVARADEMFDYLERRGNIVQELSNEILSIRQRMMADPDNADHYYGQLRVLRQLTMDDYFFEAMEQTPWDRSLLDSLERSVQRAARRDMAHELEVNNGRTDQ